MITRVFLPAILAIATIAAASMWIVPEDGDFEALFDHGLLESITAQPVLDAEDLLDRYFQERERYLPITPPCEREFVQTVGMTAFDPDTLPVETTDNLIAHSCAPALYAYRIYLGEEETASGSRRWFALNADSETIWTWPVPADYNPHARVEALYPEVFEAAAAGDPEAMATWEVLQRLYDPARLVIALDVLHQDDAVKYVWAESLFAPEASAMGGGGGGPPAAPESGGAFEIASIARYGDGLRITLTNTVAGEAYQIEWKQDLLPESVDWTVVASGSSNQTVFDLPMPQYRSGVFRAAQIEEPSVATPEFSPDGGSYSGPTNVVVTCATPGAAIFYTTNGVDPTALDMYVPNGGSIELTEGVTLKARGFHADLAQSAVASATYSIPSTPDASSGDQQILTGSTSTTLEGSVSGAGPFTVTWSKLSGPGSVTFGDASQTNTTASFSQNGIYQLQMIACDGSLCSTDTVIVAVNSDFRVVIDEPEDSSTCSMPTNLLLRATPSGGTATQVAFYADGVHIDAATEAPFGIEWDNVPAGTHELVAIARSSDADNAIIESDPISITVIWTEDVGNFALSVTDLQIPAPGRPITLARTYETRYDDGGEMGEKWKLDHEWVKAEKSRSLSSGWTGIISSPAGCVEETTEHLVTVRLGEHESYHFIVQIAFTHPLYGGGPCIINDTNPNLSRGYNVRYEFVSLTGEGELVAQSQRSDIGMISTVNGAFGAWTDPLMVAYDDGFFSYVQWQPDTDDLLFTAPDGVRYRFHSDGSLRERIDRNDNKLTYDDDGITYSHPSNGGAERYVKLTRVDGLLTEVYDPNSLNASGQTNGPPAVKYSYDSSGNLTNVARLVDRDVPTYENTAYAYTNATYPSHITHIIDARGITNMVNVYSSEGRLQAQYDALDRATTYTYDLSGRRHIVTNRLGQVTVRNYTEAGLLTTEVGPDYAVTTYEYDAQGRRIAETNPQGDSQQYGYEDDELTATTNALGGTESAEYDDYGQVLSNTDAGNQTTSYEYDSSGNFIGVTNALNVVTRHGYDAQGNRTVETNAYGTGRQTVKRYQFDALGNLTNTIDELSHEIAYSFDNNGNRLSESQSRTTFTAGTATVLTEWTYDAANRGIQTIDAEGNTNSVTWNALGKKATETDALNRTRTWYYDAIGLLTNVTYPDTLFASYAYDAEGRRTNAVDRAGSGTRSVYDSQGRLRFTVHADEAAEETVYDLGGRVRESIRYPSPDDPYHLPRITRYGYDALGRETNRTDGADTEVETVTAFQYDANGRRTNTIDNLDREIGQVFDALGRLTETVYPDLTSESYDYDEHNRRIVVTNQADLVTAFGYNAKGQLTSVTNALGTTDQIVTCYEYDELGNVTNQVDSLQRDTAFGFDNLGRRIIRKLPLGQTEYLAHDAVGNVHVHTNFNGDVITHFYDDMNRQTNRVASTGWEADFTYTATGQRQTMIDSSGTSTYAYDLRDRLVTNKTPVGVLTYWYTGYGDLGAVWSDTPGGADVDYYYDDLARLEAVVDYTVGAVHEYTFDDVGNLETVAYDNGLVSTYTYDDLNRLTNLTAKVGYATRAAFTYSLAADGVRTNLSETVNSQSRAFAWSYDNLRRLESESITGATPTGTVSYQYDAVGNRTNRTSTLSGVSSATYAYDSNDRLTADSYDSAGNTTNSSGNVYEYDIDGRLIEATVGGQTVAYTYNADGHRISKIAGGVTNWYLADTLNHTSYAQVLEEHTNTNLTRVYTYGLDLIAQHDVAGTNTHYYGYDGNGNTRYLTDEAGAVTDTYVYEAFGTEIASSGSTTNLYRYTGEQYDPNLGFYYLRARYLNPASGRFWTMDPFEGLNKDPATLHKYLYANCNPANNLDPTGEITLLSLSIRIAVGVTVAAAGYYYVARPAIQRGRTVLAQFYSDPIPANQFEAALQEMQYLSGLTTGPLKTKVDSVRFQLELGSLHAHVAQEGRGASHNQGTPGHLFLSQDMLDHGALASALGLFAEFQHDPQGGRLGEDAAQVEFEELRDAIPSHRRTPYINTLRHGNF